MNPGYFPAGQHLVPDDAVGRQEADGQVIHAQLFQGRKKRGDGGGGIVKDGVVFTAFQPFSKTGGTPLGPQARGGNAQPPFLQDVLYRTGQRTVGGKFRQKVHFIRNQRHQLSGMAVNEQVHLETGGVQRIQQPQKSAFRAPQLHVLNGYEYTFHLHASVRMWPISPRKGDVLNSTSTSRPSGMTTEIMPHMNRFARGEEK